MTSVDNGIPPSSMLVTVRRVSHGFDIDPDVLRAHARRLTRVADEIDAARRRAPSVSGAAFGVLCTFLPAAVGVLEHGTRDALLASSGVVDDTCDEVVRMVGAYERCDDGVADVLRRLS
jgi:hypothetical protein